jgi:hypothetical protein
MFPTVISDRREYIFGSLRVSCDVSIAQKKKDRSKLPKKKLDGNRRMSESWTGIGVQSSPRACLVHGHILPNLSVASHKSVAATKNMAKKYEAKLWQKLATTITL